MDMKQSKTCEAIILDLRLVFIRLSPQKDVSAVQEVTGRVQRIVMRALIFGLKLDILGSVEESVAGKALEPSVSFTVVHFVYQLCSSLLREDTLGRSAA